MNALVLTFATVLLPVLSGADRQDPPTVEQTRQAVHKGVEFLIKDQNPDGSWGGAQNAVYTFTGPVWSNPETHRSWKVATTGLCVMALLEVSAETPALEAADRGVDYILKNANVKRPNAWDLMQSWAYIYGLQALAEASGHPRYTERRSEFEPAVEVMIKGLGDYQSVRGGWGYLDLDTPKTRRTLIGTSFTTASGVIALQESAAQGFKVDEAVLERAARVVEQCRLPNGAYTYRIRTLPQLHSEYIDQVKGSLSRIQVCHEALLQSGRDITMDMLKTGMGHFFREHRFLDIARNRPIPHETFYYNSGYFYLYGHYYAALVIQRLSKEDQEHYWPLLRYEVVKLQQEDGSMWDYDMHNYHKPYGVAFGLLALGYSLESAGSEGDASAGK